MMSRDEMRVEISLSAGSDWPRPTPPGLVAYAARIDEPARSILLRAWFDTPPTGAERDDLVDTEGRVADHFPDDWTVNTSFVLLAAGEVPDLPADEILYRRGDAETPRDRWMRGRDARRSEG